jgi:hypothetical protein
MREVILESVGQAANNDIVRVLRPVLMRKLRRDNVWDVVIWFIEFFLVTYRCAIVAWQIFSVEYIRFRLALAIIAPSKATP